MVFILGNATIQHISQNILTEKLQMYFLQILVCSTDAQMIKMAQWTAINSPGDKDNDRNVALTQGTEKHCHSLLLVPRP